MGLLANLFKTDDDYDYIAKSLIGNIKNLQQYLTSNDSMQEFLVDSNIEYVVEDRGNEEKGFLWTKKIDNEYWLFSYHKQVLSVWPNNPTSKYANLGLIIDNKYDFISLAGTAGSKKTRQFLSKNAQELIPHLVKYGVDDY